MLETLVGRLKWERTGGGIRVVIPEPASFADILAIVIAAALPFAVFGFLGGSYGSEGSWGWAMAGAVSLLLTVPLSKELVERKKLVTLTSAALTVTTSHPCERGRTQLTHTIWNLRSNPRVSLMGKEFRDQIQVEIDTTSGTWTIGSRLTEAEAAALISKMMEVFVFPEWMPAYKAAVSQKSGSRRD